MKRGEADDFVERGRVTLELMKPTAARADFERALKLDPSLKLQEWIGRARQEIR